MAVEAQEPNGQSDVWVYDLSGETALRRLTQGGNNGRPLWTPDAKRLVFTSELEGGHSLFWQPADGSGVAERLTTADKGVQHYPESWSPDGRTLSFATIRSDWSVWTLSLDGDRAPKLFHDGPNNQFGSVFSPDGKWLAYTDLFANGIYVQPFPPTGAKYEVSQTIGAWPVWSRDGRRLFYRLTALSLSAPIINVVDIVTESTVRFTNERAIPVKGILAFQNYRDYDVASDGKRLMVIVPADAKASTPSLRPNIQVILNWFEELKQRVPSK